MTIEHRLIELGELHPVANWAVANLAALPNITTSDADIGKMAWVAGKGHYVLAATSPNVWEASAPTLVSAALTEADNVVTLTLTLSDGTVLTTAVPTGTDDIAVTVLIDAALADYTLTSAFGSAAFTSSSAYDPSGSAATAQGAAQTFATSADSALLGTVNTSLANKADKVTTVSAGTGLSGGGSLAANRTLSLANTAVTAGSYGSSTLAPVLTIDAQGRVTSASTAAIATYTDANTRATALTGLSTATGGLIVAGDSVLNAFGKLQYQVTNFTLGASGVTAGAYGGGIAKLMAATFNAAGQATAASTTTFSTPSTVGDTLGGCTGLGDGAQGALTSAYGCTAYGTSAQKLITTAPYNTAVGCFTQTAASLGQSNTAVGYRAQRVSEGTSCTAVGANAQKAMLVASNNTAIGSNAQQALTTGISNTSLGASGLYALTTGWGNISVGHAAGSSITTGSGNMIFGSYYGTASMSDNIVFASFNAYGEGNIKLQYNATNWIMQGALFQNVAVATTLTPTANSQLVVEATSNTLLTFKLKGTDGTVRTATLALA